MKRGKRTKLWSVESILSFGKNMIKSPNFDTFVDICFQDASRAARSLAGITNLKEKSGKLAKKAAKRVVQKKNEGMPSLQPVSQDPVLFASKKKDEAGIGMPSMQPVPPDPVLLAAANEDEGIPSLEPVPPDPVD